MRIGVLGAGSIGCYLGGRLLASGVETLLVGRAALAAEVAASGLSLSDYRGFRAHLAARRVAIATSPEPLAGCDVVLVTVKGGDTASAGDALAGVVKTGAIVVSFQNGVQNPAALRAALPRNRVLAGMVPFNVLRSEGAAFHQGTSGRLAVERTEDGAETPLVRALVAAGLPTRTHADMNAVLWGKLLVNLNNSINALAGVPLKEQLGARAYRRVMAACVREGVAIVTEAGISPVVDFPLPIRFLPAILSLPDPVFHAIARSMVRIDPHARSSMWDDLERGRSTEVDALNGEIVRLAARIGRVAPINASILARVKEAEGHRSPGLDAAALGAIIARAEEQASARSR